MTAMSAHTKTAVVAILRADPNLDGERIAAAVAVLDGKGGDPAPLGLDRVVRFADAERVTGKSRRTLRNYARQGLLRFVVGAGGRAIGVSADSLQSFMQRGADADAERGCRHERT